MPARSWLRHPPRTIRPPLARQALGASYGDAQLTATPCDLCDGAHHTAR